MKWGEIGGVDELVIFIYYCFALLWGVELRNSGGGLGGGGCLQDDYY